MPLSRRSFDNDDFVGFRSLRAQGIYVWTIREKESDTRRSGYKPLALLLIDLLASLMAWCKAPIHTRLPLGFKPVHL